MKTQYKLLQDLPGVKVGTIFTKVSNESLPSGVNTATATWFSPENQWCPVFAEEDLQDKEWFEKISSYPKSWGALSSIGGFYITSSSEIREIRQFKNANYNHLSIFAIEKQAKSSLAFAQLSQLISVMNGDWVPDWEAETYKYTVERFKDGLRYTTLYNRFYHLVFQTEEMAKFSLEHHNQLWKDYWMID
jgi:hypothetical protein